ncbi:MAG: hypothetical protein V1709_07765 [Planctomycetota bacterium]
MRIFSVSLLLLFLFFTAQLYAAPEIDSVKIGWGEEGYYRTGYFTPARIRLKSNADFEGAITIRIDNLSYSKDLKITKDSTETVRFDILILSSKPLIEIITGDPVGELPTYTGNNLSIQNISPDEFLIAVEKSYLTIFRDEFTQRYPDATKKTKFISFQTDELPQTTQSYESLDLVVLPNANLSPSIQNALYNWSINMDGIVLYKSNEIENLSLLFSKKDKVRPENPCLNADIYKAVIQKHIPDAAKRILLNYTLIYIIIIFILLFFIIWLKQINKSFIFAVIILVFISIILLYSFYLPSDSFILETIVFDKNTGTYNLIADESAQQVINQNKNNFIRVWKYSSEKKEFIIDSLPVENITGIKPIYKNMETLQSTKIHFKSLGGPQGHPMGDKKNNIGIKIDCPNNLFNETFIFRIY